jgi:predicted phage-related endonuclease
MAVQRSPIEDRASWLAMRQGNINASEVAILLGQSPYGSAAQLYAEKKGLRPPPAETGVMRRGRWGEAAVFEALAEEQPDWEITRAHIYLHDPELRFGGTPDGFAHRPDREGRGIVQAKTVGRSVFQSRWLGGAEDDAPKLPDGYRIQVLAEMVLSECAWGVLAALVLTEFDWDLHVFDIDRDPIAEAAIRDNVAAFWRDHLDPGVMPPFEPAADGELIEALYPEARGTMVDLRGDNRALVLIDEWENLKKAARDLDKAAETLKTEMQANLGPHTYGVVADGRCIQWKNEPRRGHVVEPSNPRVLRILKSAPADVASPASADGAGRAGLAYPAGAPAEEERAS